MLLKAVQKVTLNIIGIFVNLKSASAYSYIMGDCYVCNLQAVMHARMVFGLSYFFQITELHRA